MVTEQYSNQAVMLDVKLADGIDTITGDRHKMEQVVINLVSNAKFAVDEKEKQGTNPSYKKLITITSGQDDANVFFSVEDNGVGIKQKDLEKIFDPFFTTKKEDKGTGLGLSISYGFIKDILGEIKVESQEGEFTRFEVIIPKS
jgi:signal transduction histidine kinase